MVAMSGVSSCPLFSDILIELLYMMLCDWLETPTGVVSSHNLKQ